MPISAIDLLKLHLSQQAARGVTHLSLSQAARARMKLGQRGLTAGAAVTLRPALGAKPAPPSPGRGESAPPLMRPAAPPVGERNPPPAPAPSPATASPAPRPLPQRVSLSEPQPGDAAPRSRQAALADLAREAEHSEAVKTLGTLRDIMVFSTGDPHADILFVGEAPGGEEEKQREPFVGPAGQLLTKIIQAMGLRRSEVYITNVCKFRPKLEDGRDQGSRNRPPTKGEILACQPYVMAELEIVKPKVIVALGNSASAALGIEGTVGRLRGQFQDFRGTPLMLTYHPSFLLRKEQEDGGGIVEKRLVWEDMMQVMEHVGLPISDKQRRYFSKAKG